MKDQNRDSIEEIWLSTLADFYIPRRLLVQSWSRWFEREPATGTVHHGKSHLRASLEAVRDTTTERSKSHFFVIEEENDRYWEVEREIKAPQNRSTLHGSTGFIETAPYIVINFLSRSTLLGTRSENNGQLGRLRFLRGFLIFEHPTKRDCLFEHESAPLYSF